MSTTEIDIEGLARWGKPREVQTKNGPRLLRKAKPTELFYAAWSNGRKEALRAAGLSMGQDRTTGEWEVLWWQTLDKAVLAKRAENLELSRAADADVVIPVPDGLAYLPFQRAGIRWCSRIFAQPTGGGAFIADEMGLGKTIQAIGTINAVDTIHRVLIVTKASLKTQWARECAKWLVRPMTIGIGDAQNFPATDVVIMNWDVLWKWPTKLSLFWDLVVLDETVKMKNRKTRTAKSVIGYKPSKKEREAGMVPTSGIPARRRLALSGAPIENRPEELWSVLNFLDPDRWSSFWGYAKRFCGMADTGFGVTTTGASNLEELNRTLRQETMIRRLKCDVLKELPPKTRTVHELPTDGCEGILATERAVWGAHEADLEDVQARLELAKASDSDDGFKEAVAQMRQASQIAFTEISKVRHATAVAKIPAVLDAIEDDLEEMGPKAKILVFAHHHDVLDAIFHRFSDRAVLVTGLTPVPKRQAEVDRFMQDARINLFVGSTLACGEGYNLQLAKLVIFVEEEWSPGKLSQAEDRAHRYGQKDNVLVKHLVLPGSIDAKMLTTILAKQAVIDKALDERVKVELLSEPVIVPKHQSLGTRSEIAQDALLITDPQREAVHAGLRQLAGMDADYVRERNGVGPNRVDAGIVHSLADCPRLSNKQVVLGRKVCAKYVKQLGVGLVEAMGR